MDRTSILKESGEYVVGSHRFAEDTKTCFKSSSNKVDYYTLKDIVFFLENLSEESLTNRRVKAREANVNAIVIQDYEDLRAYLFGEVDTCSQIDKAKQNEMRTSTTDASSSMYSGTDSRITYFINYFPSKPTAKSLVVFLGYIILHDHFLSFPCICQYSNAYDNHLLTTPLPISFFY